MDKQTTQTTNQEPDQKPSDKKSKKKTVICVLIILLIALAVGCATYLWRDSVASNLEEQQAAEIATQKATIADLEKKLATTETVAKDDSEPCTEITPDTSTIDNIEASITSGNTAALSGYMASSVNVILAASEAYGPQTPAQAVEDISNFISADSTSWNYNFALPATTLSSYQSGDYKQYFPTTALVGKASNGQVISFSFDCNGKIDTVFLLGQ